MNYIKTYLRAKYLSDPLLDGGLTSNWEEVSMSICGAKNIIKIYKNLMFNKA